MSRGLSLKPTRSNEGDMLRIFNWKELVEKKNIEDLIVNVGSGGGGAAVAVAASRGAAPAAATAPAAEEKKEEPKEESDDDMGFSLFD
ncbi:hypothetical protein QQ045_007285 [Rhodiola kirilowii]